MLGLINAHVHLFGSGKPIKVFQIIVIERDPIQDISCLSIPQMVVVDGNIIFNPRTQRYKDIDQIIDKINLN